MNPQLNNNDELIDIVDEHDAVIATMWRSEATENNIQYSRIVLGFIVNQEGKICILRRSANKNRSPLHLALVGGAVQSGETYDDAFKRELQEEANLDADYYDFKWLGHIKPNEGQMGHFAMVYEVKVDHDQIAYNPDDFCEYHWMTPQEFFAHAASGDKIVTGLPFLIERFYA
jgi:ADP-ribose pyrophosphatase YjhB (NUDIX family)